VIIVRFCNKDWKTAKGSREIC